MNLRGYFPKICNLHPLQLGTNEYYFILFNSFQVYKLIDCDINKEYHWFISSLPIHRLWYQYIYIKNCGKKGMLTEINCLKTI